MCPADVSYARPQRARNTFGEWKVVINLPSSESTGYRRYGQTVRLEQCIYPGAPCSYIAPGYSSSCLQKYSFVRLLAYTFSQGLHIDSFKLPVACSCHVTALSHPSIHLPPLRLQRSPPPPPPSTAVSHSPHPYKVSIG